MLIDSVLKAGKHYYSQLSLEKHKCINKENLLKKIYYLLKILGLKLTKEESDSSKVK